MVATRNVVFLSGYFIWNPLLLSCFTIHVPAIHLHFRHHAELLRSSLILIMQIVPFTPTLSKVVLLNTVKDSFHL